MPADTTVYNIHEDTAASMMAARHPARADTAEDTNVTDAWATHDFYTLPDCAFRVVNSHAVEIPHSPMSYETGDIGSPTTVIREKYYPFTTDEKAILDELVTRKMMVYGTIPPAPA